MVRSVKTRAFTLLELMVSIFITITIIASFYKLYEASLKTERAATIRVSVNLLGEQICETLADSMKLIGLNGQKMALADDPAELTSTDFKGSPIFYGDLQGTYGTTDLELTFNSPYGSPITKTEDNFTESDTHPNCKTFHLFNSAAFHNDVKKLYFHTQYGIVPANVEVIVGADQLQVNVNQFESDYSPSVDNKKCKDLFPAGTLVTGEDFRFQLSYQSSGDTNHLLLTSKPVWGGSTVNQLIKFDYDEENQTSYSMPRFSLQFLRERTDGEGNIVRNWTTSVSYQDIKEVIAVRFGFIILSKKERVTVGEGSVTEDLPEYCIFDEKEHDTPCYQLPSLNYTASVFRRVVYLANYKMLIDSAKIK